MPILSSCLCMQLPLKSMSAMTLLVMIIATFFLFSHVALDHHHPATKITNPPPPHAISLNLYHRDFIDRKLVKDPKSLVEARLKRDALRYAYLTSLLSGWKTKKVTLDHHHPATKITHPPQPHTISIKLYHRDFIERKLVKDQKSLVEARLKRDASRYIYLTSVLSGSSTPLSPSDGEYVVPLLIGSRHELEFLVLDTGSPVTWWQCGPCDSNKCYGQNIINPIYNSSASSTFQEVDCRLTPSTCVLPQATCSAENHRCGYELSYGGGQKSIGFMAYEQIKFPTTKTYSSIVFGCAKDQSTGTPFGSSGFAGIVGLGGGVDPEGVGRLSLAPQLNSTLFSFCLSFPTSETVSWMYFNTVPHLPAGYNVKVPILRDENRLFYHVQLAYIAIGYYKIDVKHAAADDWNGRVIVDSGTTISRIPRPVYNLIKESTVKWMAAKNLKPLAEPYSPFDLCYDGYVDIGDFPTMELVFDSSSSSSGDTLYLHGDQVAIQLGHVVCLAFFPTDDAYSILGNTQLYGTALTFNLSPPMTLTFTANSCNP